MRPAGRTRPSTSALAIFRHSPSLASAHVIPGGFGRGQHSKQSEPNLRMFTQQTLCNKRCVRAARGMFTVEQVHDRTFEGSRRGRFWLGGQLRRQNPAVQACGRRRLFERDAADERCRAFARACWRRGVRPGGAAADIGRGPPRLDDSVDGGETRFSNRMGVESWVGAAHATHTVGLGRGLGAGATRGAREGWGSSQRRAASRFSVARSYSARLLSRPRSLPRSFPM